MAPLPVSASEELEAFAALRCIASLCWVARSAEPAERRDALAAGPFVPLFFRQLEAFAGGGTMGAVTG